MLRVIDSPENVLAVEAVGKLEKKDYETVLVPGIKRLLDGPGEIRVVFVFADKFEGLTPGATASDAKLFVDELVHRALSKWKRCAVVTNHDWLGHAIELFRWMMPGEVRTYEPSDLAAGLAWAAA